MSLLRSFKLHRIALAAASIAASTIVLSATVNRNSGVAPLYIHVDTTATTSSSTTRPFHEIEYRTVCSDTGMGNWANGSKPGTMPKATQIGPLAGFVLENAGTWTLTTTAYINGVASTPVTNIIVVTAADTQYAGTATACYSATGSATGAPSGATIVTGSDWGTALATLTTGGTVRRILLNRGETFTCAGNQKTLAVLNTGPIHIGAYGTGAKPILSPPASETTNGGWISLSSGTTPTAGELRFVDLNFDAGALVDSVLTPIGAQGGIDRVTFLRVDFNACKISISLSENTLSANNTIADATLHTPQNTAYAGHHIWNQWAIVDCTVAGASRLWTQANSSNLPYGIYLGASEQFFLAGNSIDVNSIDTVTQKASHVVRMNYSYKNILSNNTLKRPGASRLCLKLCNNSYAAREIQNVNVNTTAVTATTSLPGTTSATLSAAWAGATGTWHVLFSNGEEREVPLTNGSAATGTWQKALATSVTFTANFVGGETSGTLTAGYTGTTGAHSLTFSNGDVRSVNLVNLGTSASWTGGLTSAAFAATGITQGATVYPQNIPYLSGTDPAGPGAGGSKYVVVSDNDIGPGTDTSTIMVALSGPALDGDGRGQQVIFERNAMHAGADTQILVQVSWQNVTLRNNILDFRNGLYGEGIRIVKEWTSPDPNASIAPASGPVPDYVDIFNNSYSAPTVFGTSSFWGVNFYDALATNVRIQNNLAYAPLDSGYHAMIFESVHPTMAYTATNNSSNAQVLGTSPLWATTPPAATADWLLQAGSYGKNAGVDVPNWSDFFGTVRTKGSFDIGATEQ